MRAHARSERGCRRLWLTRGRCAGAAGGGSGLAPQELLAASEQGWSNPPTSARAPPPGRPMHPNRKRVRMRGGWQPGYQLSLLVAAPSLVL